MSDTARQTGLIVALDTQDPAQAKAWAHAVQGVAGVIKLA